MFRLLDTDDTQNTRQHPHPVGRCSRECRRPSAPPQHHSCIESTHMSQGLERRQRRSSVSAGRKKVNRCTTRKCPRRCRCAHSCGCNTILAQTRECFGPSGQCLRQLPCGRHAPHCHTWSVRFPLGVSPRIEMYLPNSWCLSYQFMTMRQGQGRGLAGPNRESESTYITELSDCRRFAGPRRN